MQAWTTPGPGSLAIVEVKFAYTDSDVPVADDLTTLVRLTATGHLHPEIGLVADWQETRQVIETMVERTVRGNAVLTIPSPHASQPDRQREQLSGRNPS